MLRFAQSDDIIAINDGRTRGPHFMAQLIVRNLPEAIVTALKARAARHHRSAEQEHREILVNALQGRLKRSLPEVLASMPDVGRDEDFARSQLDRRS
jgi:plasmid stability protein